MANPSDTEQHGNDSSSLTASECCQKARSLWLSPNSDLKQVEQLYRQALTLSDASSNKRRKLVDDTPEERSDEHVIQASEKLALLYLQSGRSQEASELLSTLGYTCRLASNVLDYATTDDTINNNTSEPAACTLTNDRIPCRVWDNFLTPQELQHLRSILSDPQFLYWTDHQYSVEPPSPYFSFLIPLDRTDDFGFLGRLIVKIRQQLIDSFPLLAKATTVELWAHNRPHASGHQMHFDSDNEGQGGTMIRNPIVSTILYLTSSAGGPSFITNQKLVHRHLATRGWACPSQSRRLVAFDGKVLHGVIPGKGSCSSAGEQRRVTLMLAFWRRITTRHGGQGAARPFPTDITWARQFREDVTFSDHTVPKPVEPIALNRVYETLEGEAWTKAMGMPEYDQVYQGF